MAATIVNVQDPTTPANNLAIDSSGRIGINNWPGVQTIDGTVRVAFFPANQAVSGTIDVTDRPARSLGIVTIASGGIGTNTAPSYSIVQDGTSNGNKLRINNDGSINTSTTATNTTPMPTQDIEQTGYVAASTPPPTTNAGSDTPYTFSSQVNRVIIQNNTLANVNYAFDTASSAGSLALVPGAMLVYPKKCTALHLYTTAAQNINGTAVNNIVVLGAL